MKTASVALLLAAACLMPAVASGEDDAPLAVTIQVSPNVIAMRSQGTWLTIHVDIDYSPESSATITVGGGNIDASSVFPDDRGDLVAKFPLKDVKAAIGNANSITILITGTTGGVSFSGEQTVRVTR